MRWTADGVLEEAVDRRDLVTLDRFHHFGRRLGGQLVAEVGDCEWSRLSLVNIDTRYPLVTSHCTISTILRR